MFAGLAGSCKKHVGYLGFVKQVAHTITGVFHLLHIGLRPKLKGAKF